MTKATDQIVGYVGAGCLSLVLIPQVVHTFRTRTTESLSLAFIVLEIMACAAFIVYGIMLPGNDGIPVVVSNGIAGMCALALLYAKLTFDRGDGSRTAGAGAGTLLGGDPEGGFEGYAPLGSSVTRTPYGSIGEE